MDIFTKFDFFGRSIKLNIDRREKIKSGFGTILSNILIIVIIILWFLIGQDIIYKQSHFYSSNKYNSYVRKYIKIPEIMASVGGLIKACSFVIVLFYNVYLNINRNEFLINKIINTKLLTSSNIEKENIHTNYNIIVHTSQVTLKNKDINSTTKFTTDILNKKSIEGICQKIKSKYESNDKLKLTFINKINVICFAKCRSKSKNVNNKIAFYDKVSQQINKQLDIIYILKNITKLKLIEKIIFNANQLSLIDLIYKIYGVNTE